jgi:hypothetical protein
MVVTFITALSTERQVVSRQAKLRASNRLDTKEDHGSAESA